MPAKNITMVSGYFLNMRLLNDLKDYLRLDNSTIIKREKGGTGDVEDGERNSQDSYCTGWVMMVLDAVQYEWEVPSFLILMTEDITVPSSK